MKKIILLIIVTFSLNVIAQDKVLEGILVSKQTFKSDNEQMSAQLAMLGEISSTTYFKGGKSRVDVSNPMSGETTVIIDNNKQEMVMMLNNPMLGKKYVSQSIKLSDEDLEKIIVTPKDDIKTVMGYVCKRYDVKTTKDGVTMNVKIYTTNKIDAPSQQNASFGDKLKGFPLYIEMSVNQMGTEMVIITEVTEFKKEKVDDAKFDTAVPEGYEKVDKIPGIN